MDALRKRSEICLVRALCAVFAVILAITLGTGTAFASSEASAISSTQQQAETIEGVVTDKKGEPLIGVSVVVKGTTNGTLTDIDGKYSLNVASGAEIVYSYVGYVSQTVLANKNVINIVMDEDAIMMDDVVVVGYGVQKKENLTGAVASINLDKTIESRPIADVGRALQGSVPGLTVSTRSGEIGSTPTIKIRGGIGSPNGESKPLILVDNVEVSDITLVNPDDIESISVLKDAASSSIYGARAAFGVVLITTKTKSKYDRVKVSYSNNFAWRTPTTKSEQLPGWQQAEINLLGVQSAPVSANSYNIVGNMIVDQKTVDGMKAWAQQYGNGKGLGNDMVYGRDFEIDATGMRFYRTWDWYDMYVKDWMPQQTHNLSLSGGNGKTNYNGTLGYLNQEGLTKVNSDQYTRYNANLSLNTEVSKYLRVRGGVLYARTNMDKPMNYNSDLYDYMYYLYRWQPNYPYGTYDGKPFRGALTELENATTVRDKKDYTRLTAGLTLTPMEGLSVDWDMTYSTNESRNKKYGDPSAISGYNIFSAHKSLADMTASYGNYVSSSYNYVYEDRGRTQMLVSNLVATYSKKIKEDHDFKFMLGSNLEKNQYTYITAKRMNLLDPSKPELSLGTGDQTVGSEHTHWAVAGFFGRVNYAFKDRYLIEFNGRYDGSSMFPESDRFAFFPSISAGYRISEEDFMRSFKPHLSMLKLRGSYGTIGNQDVGENMYVSVIGRQSTVANYWYINGLSQTAMLTPTVVSRSLSWEKVRTVDFGLDARVWDDKVGVTFDWYKRTTSDILTQALMPETLGAASPYTNMGEIQTPGWELAVDFRHTFANDLTITLAGQISDYKTKVTQWTENTGMPLYGGYGNGWTDRKYYKKGMVLGDIWGLKVDRLLQESDFNADGSLKAGIPDQSAVFPSGYKFAPGDVLYKSLDGNNTITKGVSTENPQDLAVIGNVLPRYEYGFSIGAEFKGFDFNMFFQGVGKRKLWAMGNQVLPGYTAGEPYYKGADDYWRPDNPNGFYPRPMNYSQVASGNYNVNDRYLLDMAYLRCKTITLGYTLPRAFLKKYYIDNLRVYVTAENLFEFDNLKPDIDPETDVRYTGKVTNASADARNFGRSYPYQRTLSFGLQLTL